MGSIGKGRSPFKGEGLLDVAAFMEAEWAPDEVALAPAISTLDSPTTIVEASALTARKRHHLSHAHVQMARELGMNPATLGKLDNAEQEPWKLPLPAFIESLCRKRFDKDHPDVVHSIEERAVHLEQKKGA